MTRKVIYLVAAKFLFDWKARRPFPPVSLALRDAGVTKKSISWDIRSGNPRSIVFFSTGVRVCLYGLGLANVRVRPAAGIETVCLARPRREVVSIYRRQQGIRTLPFYPNVIPDKYENSYVAAVYTSGLFDIFPKRLMERSKIRCGRNRGRTQVGNMTSKFWYPTAHANNVVFLRSTNSTYSRK